MTWNAEQQQSFELIRDKVVCHEEVSNPCQMIHPPCIFYNRLINIYIRSHFTCIKNSNLQTYLKGLPLRSVLVIGSTIEFAKC